MTMMIDRKRPLLSILAGLLAAPLVFAQRPNIVFIFSDDHAPQTIGAYNLRLSAFSREQKITPNIDRLAAFSELFQLDDLAFQIGNRLFEIEIVIHAHPNRNDFGPDRPMSKTDKLRHSWRQSWQVT